MSGRESAPYARTFLVVLSVLVLGSVTWTTPPAEEVDSIEEVEPPTVPLAEPHEKTSDLARPGPDPRLDPLARSSGARVASGAFVSIQVNVDALGQNIVGDAANEPSLAISPVNPLVIVIGWRQFDSVLSNFREAGWAYSHDGGTSWTFPGVLQEGVFRTDPVLGVDAAGVFYYQSLTTDGPDLSNQIFRSLDAGLTWQPPVEAFGGDKNWMAVDRTGGIGDGHVYGIWQRLGGCCGTLQLTRSSDGGATFETPVEVHLAPALGTLAVGPDGELYAAGVRGDTSQDLENFVVSGSLDARNPALTPSFTGVEVDLGGALTFNALPSPAGIAGQVNVVVDHSTGPTRGNVYLLASVDPPPAGDSEDPLDVHVVRSEDGGLTWSAPVRINDDPPGEGAWHWFGAIDVSPSGRIDVVWNDTRDSGEPELSRLYYAYSYDAGVTWLGNVPVSPEFDSTIGYPANNKLGDYNQLISHDSGASLAWAATFNGEQDVYYLRVFPDCNGNGQIDDQDVVGGTSPDCNVNQNPDECDVSTGLSGDCNGNDIPDECDVDPGPSNDCNSNLVPDECEPDCNDNGMADECDIADRTSVDCPGAGNGVPDECEPDCNGNGTVDTCEVALGNADDCNLDGVPDECEPDCDGNDVPDPCQTMTVHVAEIVTLTAGGVVAIDAGDLDGDGDLDVLSATQNDGVVSWYENLDGLGSFGPRRVIQPSAVAVQDAHAADVDGDGDLDVVYAQITDVIAWQENLGAGTFGAAQWVSNLADAPWAIFLADLDGDTDLDLLSAALGDDIVGWHENLDGEGTFGARETLSGALGNPSDVIAADLDGDGDRDVVACALTGGQIIVVENLDGAGSFGSPVEVTDDAAGAASIDAADLDGDGTVDLLSAGSADDEISWHRNDGAGSFGTEQTIGSGFVGARAVAVADLDGDGDADVLAAAEIAGEVVWFENLNGTGTFGPAVILSSASPGALDVGAHDVDGDGDVDLLSASPQNSTIAWFCNLGDDCNGNAVPDVCEPNCDGDWIIDACELDGGSAVDCDGDRTPDACEVACPGCDADGDRCVDELDPASGDPSICGDGDGDGCDDCSVGVWAPDLDGPDEDQDGFCDVGDCDAANPHAWSEPSPIDSLRLKRTGAEVANLSWLPSAAPGGRITRYDVIASPSATDFAGAASCVSTDDAAVHSFDAASVSPGHVRFYLVRAESDCPGGTGSLGPSSDGTPRSGRACP